MTLPAICGMLVNAAIFFENIEKISRIFLWSISRKHQNTNVLHFEYLSLIDVPTGSTTNILDLNFLI